MIAASVPVVLFGLALLLAATLNIHQGWAMILAAPMAVALACPMVILCMAQDCEADSTVSELHARSSDATYFGSATCSSPTGTRITGATYSKSMISSPSGTRCMLVHPNAFGAFRKAMP